MSELRRIGSFKDRVLSGGRVVLSDAEGDIRLEYRDGNLYLHDKESVGAYVDREVMPRIEGLKDDRDALYKDIFDLKNEHYTDVKNLRNDLKVSSDAYLDLKHSMPLDKIKDGLLLRYLGEDDGYISSDYPINGFEGVTYDITLGDVLRSSLLCLDVVEEKAAGGMSRLSAELVSRDGLERRYLALSQYKPALQWERISPGGVDRNGEKDSDWNGIWRGKLFAEYSPSLLYNGTEFRCSMRKYDALLVYVSAKLRAGIEI